MTFLLLALASLALAAYPIVIYPLVVASVSVLRPRPWTNAAWSGDVAHVITVHNEEKRIAAKLENALEIEPPPGGIETIVADDGSTDTTAEIVRGYESRGVRLLRLPRSGKEAAQIGAIRSTFCRIIVFSDASTRIDKRSLLSLLEPFADDEIGAVSGTDRAESLGPGTGEELYVRYEMALRRAESRTASLVGLSGCFFAVRREIADALLPDVPSDLGAALLCIRAGKRAVGQDAATCTYSNTARMDHEFRRKRRTALGGLHSLWAYRDAINARRPLPSLQIVSHKVVRFLCPFLLMISLVLLGIGAYRREPGATVCFSLAGALVILAGVARLSPLLRRIGPVRAVSFFALSNAAVFMAWIDWFAGRNRKTWVPTSRA
jgi:glycosyltransferase involved in cell wall biosynthesis